MTLALLLSCNGNTAETGTESAGGDKSAYSQELVDGAADMIYEYNKPGIDNSVSSSFTLPSKVDYEDKTYDVEWTVDGGNGLVSTAPADDGKITVIIDPYADTETNFSMKGKVKGGEFTKDIEFKYVIKAFKIDDWKYWSENTKDVTMNIRGIVVAKYPFNAENKNIGVFLQDLDGQHGYFAYRMKCDSQDAADKDLAVGNIIIVNGKTSIYNGFREMGAGCTYTVALDKDGNPQKGEVKVVPIDEFLKEGVNPAAALDPYQGVIAKLTDAKIKSIDWNSNNAENYVEKGAGSVYVTVTKNGVDFKLYLSTSNTLTISELQAEYEKLAVGYTVDVEGPVSWYNEPQIYPCAGGITVKSTDISNEEKAANELNAINVIPSTVTSDTTIKLGENGVNYSDVKFTWELTSDGGAATLNGNVLTVKVGKAIASVTLKVTAECGGAKAEKEFKISVMPADMSEEDIVNALYTLEKGEIMDGKYTLTGKIISVDTAFSTQFNNVTVTIVVGNMTDKPVMCYRLAGDGADKIKVGDTITVSGALKRYNDTFEFDAGCSLDKVISGEGGDETTGADTEKEPPKELKTPKEIIDALYALKDGESLSGTYTLTGKISKVDTAYSSKYENVTVTIVVDGSEGKPVQCFRMKGTGADKIGVGDVITVTGVLKHFNDGKNNTYEFDAGCTLDKIVSQSGSTETTAPETTAEETKVDPPKPKTAEEILKAAYALAKGEALEGEYTLTGTITEVNTAYSSQYENVTVTIAVDGFSQYPVECFRLEGTGADTIKKNDKITVTGKIKNFDDGTDKGKVEFDKGCKLDKIDFVSEDTSPKLDTPEKIVKALYALKGEKTVSLDGGPYTLTGKITKITTPYDSVYKNITVVIAVEGLEEYPVMCYRLKGEGADTLAVGDVITVTGQLKFYYKSADNFEYEFDSGCTFEK